MCACEQLLKELVGRRREVLSVVVRAIALDTWLAVDLGEVLGIVREVGLEASRHLLLGVTADEVHNHETRCVVQEDTPPDEPEGLRYG